jgi:hypothetical protein
VPAKEGEWLRALYRVLYEVTGAEEFKGLSG